MPPLILDAAVLAAFVPETRAPAIVATAPRRLKPGVTEAAQASQRHWWVPASISIAQYGLESGWGEHLPPGSNNPFGFKSVTGQPSVTVKTREWSKARGYYFIEAGFRAFPSIADAFEEHGRLLGTAKPYAHARSLLPPRGRPLTDDHVFGFARALTGTYATAPDYGPALIHLIQINNLRTWDSVL